MDELRSKHKSLQSAAHHIALECIHPQCVLCPTCLRCVEQSAHGSPYHVHPYPSPVRLQHAFQAQSPMMFHPKGLKSHLDGRIHHGTPNDSPILGRALCLTPRGSPIPGRVSHLSDRFQDTLTLNSDTDALVAKISAMFPTVSETHIKILLKKYYNREAVVISALQVEKHPITTPGPVTMSPAASRLQRSAMGVYSALQLAKGTASIHGSSHYTPLTGTPHGSPMMFRPASGASSYYGTNRSSDGQPTRHHSPKMKLKYLKSIFPKAEETLILDVLANKDNNVQKASEELIGMGFPKKETSMVPPPPRKTEKETPQPPKKVVTIMKTLEEKNELKQKLQKKYSTVAERVIMIALESADYNEERAEQILNTASKEEETPKVKIEVSSRRPCHTEVKGARSGEEASSPAAAAPPAPHSASRRIKTWAERLKPILKPSGSESKYRSQYGAQASGPNPAFRQGPKDSLLLEDYMTWNGPNPDLRTGQTVKAEGPSQRDKAYFPARGPGSLAKGPAGLAKGSIYQKLNKKTAKIIG